MKWLPEFLKSSHRATPAGGAQSGPFIRKGVVRVSVGLDFGTHSTKVAFLQFGAGARMVRPLNFRHRLAGWPAFTLPAVGLIRDGTLIWGVEAASKLEGRPWDEGIRRLKVLLAATGEPAFADAALAKDYSRELDDGQVDPLVWSPQHVAAAALALQVAQVYTELGRLYPGRKVDAHFTIPVPIDHVQHSNVLATYRRVANTAQQLLAEDGTLRFPNGDLVSAAAEIFPTAPETESGNSRIYTLPEAVAQVASYLTSLEATTGVHGVIDIGAGTTDVCIFLLEKPARHVQHCFWYSALVIPKAATFVQQRVATAMRRDLALVSTTEADVVRACGKYPRVVEEALSEIHHLANRAWADGYCHLKKAPEWIGCPVFLCGGGALLPGAERVFQRCWVQQWPRHKVRKLPTPGDFRGDGVPFERISVAYGLSIPGPEHGHYTLPNDSPDHTPPKRYKRYEGMGGDQPYPTPDWL